MRLTLKEIDVLIGLIGDVDWGAHFNDLLTKEDQRDYDAAERAQKKLTARYWQLKNKINAPKD